MVHFVGGPSVGGYKSYINHTTAREGQWRMPRNYARPKVDIKIKNYNYCNHGAVNTGFQMPAWLQWAQFGMSFLQGLFPAKQEAPAAQPEVNPLQAQLDEMQKKIDELTKQNEELKNKKPAESDPVVVADPEKPADPEITAGIKKKTTLGEDTPEDVKYEPSYFKAEKKRSHWADFANAYDFDTSKVSARQVWQAIQKRNGYSAENPNPPSKVMLPLELDINGITVKRKDQYTIPKHDIPQNEQGNGKGQASGGSPRITKGANSTTYNVYKNNTLVQSGLNEQQAKDKYKNITGKDFSGTIEEEK